MRICFFGDSFVNGTGDDTSLGWVGRIVSAARRAGRAVTAYNLGIRGDTTQHIRARWHNEALRRLGPKHEGRLLFSFGANDCVIDPATGKLRVDRQSSIENTATILREANLWLPTLMVGPGIIADDSEATKRICDLSAQYANLCAQISVPYLEISGLLVQSIAWNEEARAGDGAHPNCEGYAVVANLIEQWDPWQRWLSR